jgi:oligosaccharyltransferase complex subunit delta (ribophorin II)
MFWLCIFQLSGDTILGLAKFFLGIGIPGDAKDFFNQVESLSFLDSNRQVLSKKQFITPAVLQ